MGNSFDVILQKLGLKKKKNIERENQNNIENIEEELINNIVKVHICGESSVKEKILQLFNSEINNPDYRSKGDYEYKTNDFYWIIKIYNYNLLTSKECDELEEIIENDKTCERGKIKHHILLLFGDNNDIKVILEEFSDINRPRIIFITKKKLNVENLSKKKEVKNIIYEGLNDRDLNNYIISSLWELDCYFNEKGNEIFRYSPKSIAKGLQTDNSFFSINILLTGMCRSGKSTFINVMSEKLVALETNDTESVTLKVSEYYIYRNDDKKEHGAIKLIDSPGICEDNRVNTRVKEKIKYYLENRDKKIENQIHFILFFFMEQATLGNATELLKLLNESNYPVFFIINKSMDRSWKKKSQDIKSKITFFKKMGFQRFIGEENFIQVNIKSTNYNFYGIDEIFKKIKQYIQVNNLLDEKIYQNMCDIQTNYWRNLINEKEENKNLSQEMSELYKSLEGNLLFKNINLENMKNHGRKIANKYEKTIILLSNIKNVFPETYNKMPIITFLQSYMIKEIGGGYGFNFEKITYCFKKFIKDIQDLKINKIIQNNSYQIKEINAYNINEIRGQRDEITSRINEIEKNTNEEVISNIAQIINELTFNDKVSQENNNNNKINIENTQAISYLCQIYFERELDNTKGIPFLIYFFNKNKMLINDIDYYIDKKDWEKDEMEFIGKI